MSPPNDPIAPYAPLPECRKCGACTYDHKLSHVPGAFLKTDTWSEEYLGVTCIRCRHYWHMETLEQSEKRKASLVTTHFGEPIAAPF